MENLSNQASALALHDDLEKTSGERVNLFYKFVEVRQEWHVVVVCVCVCAAFVVCMELGVHF